jgi:hypothetical protein
MPSKRTGAERQRRYIERLKTKAAGDDPGATKRDAATTLTMNEIVHRAAEIRGVAVPDASEHEPYLRLFLWFIREFPRECDDILDRACIETGVIPAEADSP